MAWIHPHQPSTGHVLAIWLFGVLGSGAYAGAAVATYILIWHHSLEWAFFGAVVGGVAGMACGVATLMWTLPCLLESDLSRSLPYVFALTLIASAIAGVTGWFAIVLVPASNLGACMLAYRKFNAPKWRRRRGLCEACGYDLRGLRSSVCPECGHAFQPNPTA